MSEQPSIMVERVSESLDSAIRAWLGDTGDWLLSDHLDDDDAKRFIIGLARAAIEAMREPTEWRIDTDEGRAIRARRKPIYLAVCRQLNCCGRGFDEAAGGDCATCADIGDDVIETYWRAMIDAALSRP